MINSILLGMLSGTIILILVAVSLLFTLLALVDVLKSEFEGNNKIVWLLVVLFTGLIGVLLYFTIGKKQKL